MHSNNQQNTNNAACAMLLCICLFWIAILWAASITSLSIASSNPQTTLIQLVVRLMITQSTFTSVMCLWRIWLSSSRVGYSNVYTLFWGFYLSDSPWCIWNSRNPPREKFSMFLVSTSYKYRCKRCDATTYGSYCIAGTTTKVIPSSLPELWLCVHMCLSYYC